METFSKIVKLVQAAHDGKTIQAYNGHDWNTIGILTPESLLEALIAYPCRVKPEPKTVPWEMGDVPSDCWVRKRNVLWPRLVLSIDDGGIFYLDCGDQKYINFEELVGWEYISNAPTLFKDAVWKPCHKVVE